MADAGVEFPNGPDVDFEWVLAKDTLNSDPPRNIDKLMDTVRMLDHHADLLQRLRPGALPF